MVETEQRDGRFTIVLIYGKTRFSQTLTCPEIGCKRGFLRTNAYDAYREDDDDKGGSATKASHCAVLTVNVRK